MKVSRFQAFLSPAAGIAHRWAAPSLASNGQDGGDRISAVVVGDGAQVVLDVRQVRTCYTAPQEVEQLP
jgi:hypothetical protein